MCDRSRRIVARKLFGLLLRSASEVRLRQECCRFCGRQRTCSLKCGCGLSRGSFPCSWSWFAIVGGDLLARALADSRAVSLLRMVCYCARQMTLSRLRCSCESSTPCNSQTEPVATLQAKVSSVTTMLFLCVAFGTSLQPYMHRVAARSVAFGSEQ